MQQLGPATQAVKSTETQQHSEVRSRPWVRMLACVIAVGSILVLGGTIVWVVLVPAPAAGGATLRELPIVEGTPEAQITGIDLAAHLTRSDANQARLEVVETLNVSFDDSAVVAEQVVREWPTRRLGQDLGLSVQGVEIDDEDVEYTLDERDERESVVLRTNLGRSLSGSHEVVIRYQYEHPVVSRQEDDGQIEQLRWTALKAYVDGDLLILDDEDQTAQIRPFRISLTIDPALTGAIVEGGWISEGRWLTDRQRQRDVPTENGDEIGEWTKRLLYPYAAPVVPNEREFAYVYVGQFTEQDNGAGLAVFDLNEACVSAEQAARRVDGSVSAQAPRPEDCLVDESFNETLTGNDLGLFNDYGAIINFEPGTFAALDQGASARYWVERGVSIALSRILSGAYFVVALACRVMLRLMANREVRLNRSILISVGAFLLPALTLSSWITVFWLARTGDVFDPEIFPSLVLSLLSTLVLASFLIVRGGRGKRTTPSNT